MQFNELNDIWIQWASIHVADGFINEKWELGNSTRNIRMLGNVIGGDFSQHNICERQEREIRKMRLRTYLT